MKKVVFLALVLMVYIFSKSYAADPSGAAQVKLSGNNTQLVEVPNKICPISHEEIGKKGAPHKVIYKGKVYNLCCSMCVKDFNKDPAKYTKIMEDEVAADQAAKTKQM